MENVSDKQFYEDNFFVIESNDLEHITGRIYGYAIDEKRIIINSDECNYGLPKETYGCYINVVTKPETIELYQDYFGSYGIYLYEKDDYFALSNSFLYLVNYLEVRKALTFDDEYAKAFLAAPQASLAYQDTMIKEIKMLPRNAYVIIDRGSKELKVKLYEQKEAYIAIDSKEAVEIIDTWHKKWNAIFKTIYEEGLDISFGISGGKDSRVSLACCLKPSLDLDRLNFFSSTDGLATHSDDYRIAKQIAETYGFSLNVGVLPEKYKMNPLENLKCSLLVKCGFHRELMPSHFWHKKPVFRITGSGGDLRELWSEPAYSFIERMCSYTYFNSVDCRGALKNVMTNSKKQIDANYGGDLTAADYFYKHGRQRNHNGKGNAELFMSNAVILSPLMDPSLYKLNQNIGKANDNDLLYAVIYNRYLPEIFDLGFDSGRIVKKETMDIASAINNTYPLNEEAIKNFGTIKLLYNRIAPMQSNDKYVAHDYLKKIFYTEEVKKFATYVFGEEMYKRADVYYRTRDYHPYIAAAGLVEAYIIYEAVQRSKVANEPSSILELLRYGQEKDIFVPQNYSNNGFMKECFDYLQSGRFDIKNCGSVCNEIKFLGSSDEKLYISTPDWFIDSRGRGMVFQSVKGDININFKTVGNGELLIKLMGPWIKDDDNQPLSIKIDFTKFQLRDLATNEVLISELEPFTVDCTNVRVFKVPCSEGWNLVLEASWLPYIYREEELFYLLGKMYQKGVEHFTFWKKGDSDS